MSRLGTPEHSFKPLSPRTSASRAADFAATLQSRYGVKPIRATLPNRALRRTEPNVLQQFLHQYTQVQFAPSLHLAFSNWFQAALQTPENGRVSPMALPNIERARALLRPNVIAAIASPAATRYAEQLSRTLIQRGQRIETLMEQSAQTVRRHASPQSDAAETMMMDAPRESAVRRVVRRTAVLPTEPASDSTGSPKRAVRDGTYENTSGTRRTPEPPIDLNRLTEQVIQTIDHRILARRERMGRL